MGHPKGRDRSGGNVHGVQDEKIRLERCGVGREHHNLTLIFDCVCDRMRVDRVHVATPLFV